MLKNHISKLLNRDLLTPQLKCVDWNTVGTKGVDSINRNDKFLLLSNKPSFSLNSLQFNPVHFDFKYTIDLNLIYNNLLNHERNILFREKNRIKIEKAFDILKDPIDENYLDLIPVDEIKREHQTKEQNFTKTILFSEINDLNEQNEFFNVELNKFVEEALDETEQIKHSIYYEKNQLQKHAETNNDEFFKKLKEQDSSIRPSFLSVWPKEKWRIKYIPKIVKKSEFIFDLKPRPVQKYAFYHELKLSQSVHKYETILANLFHNSKEFKYELSAPNVEISYEPLNEDIHIWEYDSDKDPFVDINKPHIGSEIEIISHFINKYEDVYYSGEPTTEEGYTQSISDLKKEKDYPEDTKPIAPSFNNEIFDETVSINTLINEYQEMSDNEMFLINSNKNKTFRKLINLLKKHKN